ncbi:MAG: ATP-binding protein [Crocinitomicaceae bacterium]|nr:ATP-binding protein [Flavobacteriales bacterium]NQZ36157.1 ATP-binding protein [Crocinitomicaceae bacterium]
MRINQTLFTNDLEGYVNLDKSSEEQQLISGFEKVNFFIGPNNSGKSRMMRTMFWGEHTSMIETDKTELFQFEVKSMIQLLEEADVSQIEEITLDYLRTLSEGIPVIYNNAGYVLDENRVNLIIRRIEFNTTAIINGSPKSVSSIPGRTTFNGWNTSIERLKKYIRDEKSSFMKNSSNSLYIPILRGARPVSISSKEDIYANRTMLDYFDNMKSDQKKIFAGYNIYQEVVDLLLGDLEKRGVIRDYEEFLSRYFFHSAVTIIPQVGKDVLLIKIGEEEERLLHNLGDGVQAIILLTFPIFIRKNKIFTFYIEEPELNLHPSLQRKLLKCLSEEFPAHQYFISTHSNHFLEAFVEYENTAIFSFKKAYLKDEFHVQLLTSIKSEILDNLGVRNSSVLMANCTIWVEGITDRLYLQKYLEVYFNFKKKRKSDFLLFKEDQHFAFVEYAGSNIVHWDFNDNVSDKINASFIANNILLIADSDHKNGKIPLKKKERFDTLRKSLKDNFVLIESKEIENTLSLKTIQSVVDEYEKGETLMIRNVDYSKKNLGEWINDSFEGLKRDYADHNTISNKLNFCKKAIKHIKTREDLSDEAMRICQIIYSFIEKNNVDYLFQETE